MWIDVDGYELIPEGVWVVKFDSEKECNKYGVMHVTILDKGHKFATCGNAFAFDLPRVIAYQKIPD